MIISSFWNLEEDNWKESNKQELKYDLNGNQVLSKRYYWNLYENNWCGSNKWESKYDSTCNQVWLISYNWNYDENDWGELYKSKR